MARGGADSINKAGRAPRKLGYGLTLVPPPYSRLAKGLTSASMAARREELLWEVSWHERFEQMLTVLKACRSFEENGSVAAGKMVSPSGHQQERGELTLRLPFAHVPALAAHLLAQPHLLTPMSFFYGKYGTGMNMQPEGHFQPSQWNPIERLADGFMLRVEHLEASRYAVSLSLPFWLIGNPTTYLLFNLRYRVVIPLDSPYSFEYRQHRGPLKKMVFSPSIDWNRSPLPMELYLYGTKAYNMVFDYQHLPALMALFAAMPAQLFDGTGYS